MGLNSGARRQVSGLTGSTWTGCVQCRTLADLRTVSSSAGSTSSSLCEHWVSRLPGSKQASVTSAASSRRTSLASLSESVEMTGERSEDDGGYGSWCQISKVAMHRQSTGLKAEEQSSQGDWRTQRRWGAELACGFSVTQGSFLPLYYFPLLYSGI